MDVRPVCKEFAFLSVFLLVIIVNAHVVGYEIVAVFHRHLLFPVKEAAHHRAELRPLVFQPVHVRGEYRAFPFLHVKPDVGRNDARIAGFIDYVKALVLQCVFQR